MNAGDVIPLFPLDVVLLPGMNLPLHIFEERYKVMIGQCLDSSSEFGVLRQEQDRLEDVGCTALIRRVLRRYPDGRLDILCVGSQRFRLLEVREEKPWLQGVVGPFGDMEEGAGGETASLAERATSLLVQLLGMLGRPADLPGLRRLSPAELSFRVAATEGFSLADRQQALESTSCERRLEQGIRGLEGLLERLRRAIEARRLSGGNGHIKQAFRG
jgi:Lon protease-like protein